MLYARLVCVSFALVALTACEMPPRTGFWKSGATLAQLESDSTDCEVFATRQVPVSTQVGTTPTYTTPVNTSCYNYGYSVQCTTTGGQVYGGTAYTYDANAGLRERVGIQCMASRGYQVVTYEFCSDAEVANGVRPFNSGRLPPASDVLCVTANGYVSK